jgi:hypothetical protein
MVIISAISTYVAVSCYYRISEYDAKLVSLNVLLNQQSEISNSLNQEDLIILKQFDNVDKRFRELEEKQRVNEVRIIEIGAKLTRRK